MRIPAPLAPAAFSVALTALASFALPNDSTAQQSAGAIVESVATSLKPPRSFSVLSKVDNYRNRAPAGSMTVRTFVKISSGTSGPHSLSVVLKPGEERGKVFLRVADDFWLYDPGAERPVQISTQQRLMGDASIADLTHFDLAENYSAALDGEETIVDSSGAKVETKRLTLRSKSRNALYPTLRLWAKPAGQAGGGGKSGPFKKGGGSNESSRMQPVKIECLSSSGGVLKTVYYSNFKGLLGMPRPTELNVVDGTAPGRVTRIRFSQFSYKDLDTSNYTTGAMPTVSGWAESDPAAR